MPRIKSNNQVSHYDCIIVGGGVAGLTAATVLARALRRVLLIDAGEQSNNASHETHGVFTHDKTPPKEIYDIAREQLTSYPETEIIKGTVEDINKQKDGFRVTTESKDTYKSRTILLAQGVKYELPEIPGIKELWSGKAWHCPYCDGYEFRGKKLLVINTISEIESKSIILPAWSRDIVWSPLDGPIEIDTKKRIINAGGTIVGKVTSVRDNGKGVSAILEDDSEVQADAVVIGTTSKARDSLAENLGCESTETGLLSIDEEGKSSVDGVYAAGDETTDMQQVNVAAASGHKAAIAVNTDLASSERMEEE